MGGAFTRPPNFYNDYNRKEDDNMITLLLLLGLFVIIFVIGAAMTVLWPIIGILVIGILIDCIFLKRFFGKKKKGDK